jgi:hypothetical protein
VTKFVVTFTDNATGDFGLVDWAGGEFSLWQSSPSYCATARRNFAMSLRKAIANVRRYENYKREIPATVTPGSRHRIERLLGEK